MEANQYKEINSGIIKGSKIRVLIKGSNRGQIRGYKLGSNKEENKVDNYENNKSKTWGGGVRSKILRKKMGLKYRVKEGYTLEVM